jgi:hypothetical protein
MGGIGSGGWRARSRWRVALEELPSVDVVRWLRADVLIPGTMFEQGLRNQDGPCGTARVAILSNSLACMLYTTTTPGNLVRISVEVHWTDCRFGGRRPWFACPRCGAQSGKLYLFNHWLCRHCCALPYRSQTLTPADRLLHRAAKLRQRLNATTLTSSLERPARMRHNRFVQLSLQIIELERSGRLMALQAFFGSGAITPATPVNSQSST